MAVDFPDPNDWINRIMSAPSTGGASGSGSSRQQGTGLVYWGTRGQQVRVPTYRTEQRVQPRGQARIPDLPNRYETQVRSGSRPEIELTPELRPEAEVRGYVYQWHGTAQYSRLASRLVSLGLIEESEKGDLRLLDEVWQDAVTLSMRMSEVGKKVSPWQALELLGGVGYGRGAGRGGFTGTRSRTSRSVDLTDPATAKAIINDALSKHLGRAANEEELRAFTATINAAERANPTVTTSTTTYQDGEAVSESSTTSGGMTSAGRQQVVADRAMELPEYGAYQAASTYFNALLASLGSPV